MKVLTNMFSNEERQKERTGKYGTSRLGYLQQLVTEFQQTVSEEAKEQIVAHLANFGYDPFNYEYLRQLLVIDLFLDCLTEPNEKLVEFAVGGISNCCPDPANAVVIVSSGGIPLLLVSIERSGEHSCQPSPAYFTYVPHRQVKRFYFFRS